MFSKHISGCWVKIKLSKQKKHFSSFRSKIDICVCTLKKNFYLGVTASLNDQAMCDSPMYTIPSANEPSTNVGFTASTPEVVDNSTSFMENALPKPATPTMNQADSMNNTNNNDTNTNFLNMSNSNSQSPLASSVSSTNLNNQMVLILIFYIKYRQTKLTPINLIIIFSYIKFSTCR